MGYSLSLEYQEITTTQELHDWWNSVEVSFDCGEIDHSEYLDFYTLYIMKFTEDLQ